MKNKILLVAFLILMIGGIVLSFFLFYQLKKSNELLESTKAELVFLQEKENDSLKLKKIIHFEDSLSKLSMRPKELDSAKADSNLLKKTEELQKKLANANYFVGVYSLGLENETLTSTTNYLQNQGYTVIANIGLTSREPWLAATSTVFYYDPSRKEFAAQLASEIGKITDTKFRVEQGAGLGVPSDKKAQYFYIHLIDQNTTINRTNVPQRIQRN